MAPPAATSTAGQKQILAAIQALSDQLTARKIVSPLDLDSLMNAQDKLGELEAASRFGPILVRLDSIDRNITALTAQVALTNGTVRRHDTELAVIGKFCDEQVKPALGKVVDLRIEFAKFVAAGGGFGVVGMLLFGAGKAAGWW